MSIKDIKSALDKDNLKSILVTGPWGSGKTYLLKKIYKNDKTACHVSIQGCHDQTDIMLKILYSLGGFWKTLSNTVVFLPDNISRYGVNLSPKVYLEKGFNYWAKKKLQKKNISTIILDDWERSSVNRQDLFEFIEEQSLNRKIICVANDNRIGNKTIKQAEKFFNINIELKQNIELVLESILKGNQRISLYRSLLQDHLVKSPNIRTLQKIIIHLNNIHETVDVGDNLRLIKQDIFMYLSYFIKCQEVGIRFSDHREVLHIQEQYATHTNMPADVAEDLESQKTKIFDKLKKYKIYQEDQSLYYDEGSEAFLDYIQYMDHSKVDQYLKNLIDFKQDFEQQKDWKRIWRWRSLEDHEVPCIGKKAIKSVFCENKVDIKALLLVVSSIYDLFYEKCIEEGQFNELIKTIEEKISEENMTYKYHRTDSGVDSDIFDHGSAYGMGFSDLEKNSVLIEDRNKLFKKCHDSYLKYIYRPKKDTVDEFNSFLNGKTEYPFDKTFSNDPIFKENIFDKVTASEFINMYSNLSNNRKREVNSVIATRTSARNLHRLESSEETFKNNIEAEIDKKIEEYKTNAPSKIHYEQLKTCFNKPSKK